MITLDDKYRIRPRHLDPYRAKCLYAIHRLGGQATQKEIKKYIGRDKSTIARTIDDLLDDGYITRYSASMEGARYLYAVQSKTVVTMWDTAKLLLLMLDEEKKHGKTLIISDCIKRVRKDDDLKDFTSQQIIERFGMLQKWEYVEVFGHHAELRHRTHLERLYLTLLADNVFLQDLNDYNFSD
jgi:predicted transcriptional regulator